MPTPPLLFYPASQPCAIHIHRSAVGIRLPGAQGSNHRRRLPHDGSRLPCLSGFPSLCLQMCLSIVEAGSCTPRGPAIAPPLSLFRVQAAAMLELLAILMDPFVCHWNIQKDANRVLISPRRKFSCSCIFQTFG